MSDDKQKKLRLVAFWLFGTILIVFGALAAYIAVWVMPTGASAMTAIMAGWPIYLITIIAAGAIYAGYYYYVNKK